VEEAISRQFSSRRRTLLLAAFSRRVQPDKPDEKQQTSIGKKFGVHNNGERTHRVELARY